MTAAAIELNDGVRKGSLVRLSLVLGVSLYSVRSWIRGSRVIPSEVECAVRSMVEVRRLRARFGRVMEAMDGYTDQGC